MEVMEVAAIGQSNGGRNASFSDEELGYGNRVSDGSSCGCGCGQGVSCELAAPGRVTSVSLQGGEGVATVKKGVTGAGKSLGDLTGLKFLVMTQLRFRFKHPVPPSLAKLKSLEVLGLFGTQFTGTTVPSFLSTLPKLNDVTIEGNYFPDGIPVSLNPFIALHSFGIDNELRDHEL